MRSPRGAVAALIVSLGLGLTAAAGCGSSDAGPPPCEATSGHICTIAGTGTAGDGADRQSALKTNLYLPQDMTVAPDGRVFIADWNNHRIRVIEHDGTLTIVAGIGELGVMSDGTVTNRLNHPTNVAFNQQGNLVIAAWHNSRIKTVDLTDPTYPITDVCGTGARGFAGDGTTADVAILNLPVAVVFDAQWNMIIADQANNRLRMVDHATDVITTIAGSACMTPPCGLGDGGPATSATFSFPAGQAAQPGGRIDIDATGNLYIADTTNARVRKIDAATQLVSTIAGTGTPGYAGDGGPAVAAQIGAINDVAVAADGSVYIADTDNDCIRVITPDGNIAAAVGICGQRGFAGDGGPANAAKLDRPTGVALDPAGNIYVADTHNQRVRVAYK